jgi:hypothetical protein
MGRKVVLGNVRHRRPHDVIGKRLRGSTGSSCKPREELSGAVAMATTAAHARGGEARHGFYSRAHCGDFVSCAPRKQSHGTA